MVEELGIQPPDEQDVPWKNGMVTFVAFIVFGFVPVRPGALPSMKAFPLRLSCFPFFFFPLCLPPSAALPLRDLQEREGQHLV